MPDKHEGSGTKDPSPFVIEMMQREIAQLQALFAADLTALRSELVTRLDAMDKALAKVEQYPTAVDTAIARVREFFDEKGRGIDIRFAERDKRFTLREDANKELLREQRLSSETAINKAEASIRQQLDAQMAQISSVERRMDRTEGKTAGAVALWGTIVAAIVAVGVVVGIVTAVAVRVPGQVPAPVTITDGKN